MSESTIPVCEYTPTPNGGFVECSRKHILNGERQILDLIACCGEHEVNKLLVHSESLPSEFYRLHSGLAGMILLKTSNYYIILAAVIPSERIGKGRFYEMVLETNRGQEFRVFNTREEAVTWLSAV